MFVVFGITNLRVVFLSCIVVEKLSPDWLEYALISSTKLFHLRSKFLIHSRVQKSKYLVHHPWFNWIPGFLGINLAVGKWKFITLELNFKKSHPSGPCSMLSSRSSRSYFIFSSTCLLEPIHAVSCTFFHFDRKEDMCSFIQKISVAIEQA